MFPLTAGTRSSTLNSQERAAGPESPHISGRGVAVRMQPDLRCYYHPELEATSQCDRCGDYLCTECVVSHKKMLLCERCVKDVVKPARGTFWKRQFAGEVTAAQTFFDVSVGVVLPIICVLADPFVFVGNGFLSDFQVFGYTSIAIGFISLFAWLVFRRPWPILTGCLIGSVVFSLVLGTILLPYSVIGLLFLIGALGFSPFVSAFAFARNGIRAYRLCLHECGRTHTLLGITLGFLIALGIPTILQMTFPSVRIDLPQAMPLANSRCRCSPFELIVSRNLSIPVYRYHIDFSGCCYAAILALSMRAPQMKLERNDIEV